MEQVTVKMEIGDLETKDKIKMTIEGKSNMPFWHQDLIFRAAISLLEDIDEKNFF